MYNFQQPRHVFELTYHECEKGVMTLSCARREILHGVVANRISYLRFTLSPKIRFAVSPNPKFFFIIMTSVQRVNVDSSSVLVPPLCFLCITCAEGVNVYYAFSSDYSSPTKRSRHLVRKFSWNLFPLPLKYTVCVFYSFRKIIGASFITDARHI